MPHALVPSSGGAVIDRAGASLSVGELQVRRQRVLEVMANVLEADKDYGRIPGTDKPTLYKPGAEMLMLTFQLAAAKPIVEDLSTDDEIRYRVNVPIEAPDGRALAVGVGEASTNEEKYRWRKPVCDEEWQETAADLRREKWFKGKTAPYRGKQVRTSPADLANTVLKMAHKRAFIHGTLLATAASSVFNQDLEDFSKEVREAVLEAEGAEPGARKTEGRQPTRRSESARGKATREEPPAATLTTEPALVEKVHKPEGKNFWVVALKDDRRFFTTFDEQVVKDADGFAGTPHKVRLTYVEKAAGEKTYLNVVGVAIADAAPAAGAPPGDDRPLLKAEDIPFGGGGQGKGGRP